MYNYPVSDTLYREQAARRNRARLLIGAIALVIACLVFASYSALQDSCTGGFERDPQSVVESYVEAIASGDARAAAACWHHLAYMDIEAGCSEICLSRLVGTDFQLQDVQLGPETNESGRARLVASIAAACPDGTQHTGEISLDSIAADVPWRHWKIVESTFGGPLSDPWCQ